MSAKLLQGRSIGRVMAALSGQAVTSWATARRAGLATAVSRPLGRRCRQAVRTAAVAICGSPSDSGVLRSVAALRRCRAARGRAVGATNGRKGQAAAIAQKGVLFRAGRAPVMKALGRGRSVIPVRATTINGDVAVGVTSTAGPRAGWAGGLSGAVPIGQICRCYGCCMV